MTNRVNEYLRKRPVLGTAFFLLLFVSGSIVWIAILQPSRPLFSFLSDEGVWFTIGLLAAPAGLVYFIVSKRTHSQT